MQLATSTDGTPIALDVVGDGPVLVVVAGALCNRHSFADLATLMPTYTVVNYDRRGRGDSGDNAAYAAAREIDDLAAVIAAAGGDAYVFGHSSGGVIALEAAAAGVPMRRLAVYEPPYVGREAPGLLDKIEGLVAAGDRDGAVAAFMLQTGMPESVVPMLRHSPAWPGMTALAHTLVYDLTLVGDSHVPRDRLSRITVPTLLGDGGDSPPEMRAAADALAETIAGSTRITFAGQTHNVDQAALATALVEFFA